MPPEVPEVLVAPPVEAPAPGWELPVEAVEPPWA